MTNSPQTKLFKSTTIIVILAVITLSSYGGMYDEDPLESGLLYRVRMDGKLPCEYLQVTLSPNPSEFRPAAQKLVKVLLLDSDKKTILQRFNEKDFIGGSTTDGGDFNFDGYRDFRSMLREHSGRGGRFFTHYTFDPKTRRYLPCQELNDLSSPYPDYQKKLMTSLSRGGGMYSHHREYRWVGEKLEVVSEVWRDGDDKGWFTEYSTFENGIKKKSKRVYHTKSNG
jgi:hypothetical protein